MSRNSLRIRTGRGLLANDNPASTFPGQQNFKRREKVSVNVGVLYECLYWASARTLRRRSAMVAENTRPTCTKWSAKKWVRFVCYGPHRGPETKISRVITYTCSIMSNSMYRLFFDAPSSHICRLHAVSCQTAYIGCSLMPRPVTYACSTYHVKQHIGCSLMPRPVTYACSIMPNSI